MNNRLVVLGLLLPGPLSGYRIHRIAATHGDIYGALTRANVYYLLSRLEAEGRVARDRPGRGAAYSVTPAGRREFEKLLRAEVRSEAPRLGVEAAAVLVRYAKPDLAHDLLARRRASLRARRDRMAGELDLAPGGAGDLLAAMLDAELGWLDRALTRLDALAGGEYSIHG